MKKLSISNKIRIGFGFVFLLCIGIGILAKINLDKLNNGILFYQRAQFPAMKKTHEASGQFRLAASTLLQICQQGKNPENEQLYVTSRDNSKSILGSIIADTKKALPKSQASKPFEDILSSVVEFYEKADPLLEVQMPLTAASFTEITTLINEKLTDLQGKSETAYLAFDGEEIKIQRELTSMNKVFGILIKILPVVLIGFGFGFTWFISTNIAGPLEKIIHSMGEAERGLLDTRIQIATQDEFQKVAESFNNMIGEIRQIISKVIETSHDLATSSQELSSASVQSAATLVDISKNVNEINTSAVEISSNLEKTSHSIDQVAVSAQQVATLAGTAVDAVKVTQAASNKGGETVKKSVEMVGKIKESVDMATQVIQDLNSASKQISEIVNTITTIASQTNLLALNAAIEAARAGEQGKGFTVVADEVRKLAEESAEAAEAIGTRIENILTKTQNAVDSMQMGRVRVDEGIRIIRDVSISLENVTGNVNDVNGKITDISRISTEQSQSSQIMARTVEDITKLTKSTSERMGVLASSVEQQTATVSQISGSTEDLARLADELQLLVTRFTVQIDTPEKKSETHPPTKH